MANYPAEVLVPPFSESGGSISSLTGHRGLTSLLSGFHRYVVNSRPAQRLFQFGVPAPVYPTRVAPDANDVIVWMCDDLGTTSVANTGAGGPQASLVTPYGSPTLGASGVFGRAAGIPGSVCSGFHTANDTSALPTSLEPAYPLTMSCWVLIRGNALNNSSFFAKSYRLSNQGWSAPYNTCIFAYAASTNWGASLIVGGTQQALNSPRRLNLNVWHHVGFTYDGSSFILYEDGDAVAETALSGAVDYGNHGPWYIGGNFINGDDKAPVVVQDVRIADVARPASYFRTVYDTAVTQFGA